MVRSRRFFVDSASAQKCSRSKPRSCSRTAPRRPPAWRRQGAFPQARRSPSARVRGRPGSAPHPTARSPGIPSSPRPRVSRGRRVAGGRRRPRARHRGGARIPANPEDPRRTQSRLFPPAQPPGSNRKPTPVEEPSRFPPDRRTGEGRRTEGESVQPTWLPVWAARPTLPWPRSAAPPVAQIDRWLTTSRDLGGGDEACGVPAGTAIGRPAVRRARLLRAGRHRRARGTCAPPKRPRCPMPGEHGWTATTARTTIENTGDSI